MVLSLQGKRMPTTLALLASNASNTELLFGSFDPPKAQKLIVISFPVGIQAAGSSI